MTLHRTSQAPYYGKNSYNDENTVRHISRQPV